MRFTSIDRVEEKKSKWKKKNPFHSQPVKAFNERMSLVQQFVIEKFPVLILERMPIEEIKGSNLL